mmetsp:Transcript_3481/g.10995  ORF Transcript_3481/g.10995 Transcript_3481/m.10995 type:complete len:252 (-) Transcript_3481:38-793(-)
MLASNILRCSTAFQPTTNVGSRCCRNALEQRCAAATALTSVREMSTLILSTSTLRTPRVRVGCGAATRRRSAGWAPSWWDTLWCMRLCASCCCRLPSAALTRPRTSLRAASAEARQRPSPRRSTLSRSECRPRSTRRRPTPTRRCQQCGERLSLRRAGASSSEVLSRGSRPTRRRAPSCLPCTRRGTGGSRRGWGRAVESSRRGAAGYESRRVCEYLRAAGWARPGACCSERRVSQGCGFNVETGCWDTLC